MLIMILHRYDCEYDCDYDIGNNKISDARAIYQNKISKVYLYFVIDDTGFVGWVSGPHKNREEFVALKISSE